MDPVLVDELSLGGTVITPTRRLASYAQLLFASLQKTGSAFSTPAIYSLSDWQKRLWTEFEMTGKVSSNLFTQTQSLLLIENIIQKSQDGHSLVDTYQTAKRVYNAWEVLHEWRSLDLIEKDYPEIDYQALVNWLKEYQSYLNSHGSLDEVMLPTVLLDLFRQSEPKRLVFYGFEEKTPFLTYFDEELTKHHWEIIWLSPPEKEPTSCNRCAFSDPLQESKAAIDFAYENFLKGKKRIAIVVPELADQRQMIEKALKEKFDPEYIAAPWTAIDPRFNISAAIPLIQYPLVCRAFEILNDIDNKDKATYQTWSSVFREYLIKQQWPSSASLTSVEYQTMMRFESLLNELCECDDILPPCSAKAAVKMLEKLASYIPFQAENKGAPVQVLGVLEAAGQQFDAIWIMGMQNETWPPSAKPNPFIDCFQQRTRGMPHSSAEREMQYAEYMTRRFMHCAEEVIFSYALHNKDQKRGASELIRTLPIVELNPPTLSPYAKSFHLRSESYGGQVGGQAECLEDSQAPSYNLNEAVRATARLLELQSACPFKAFSEYRLGLKPIEENTIWLSAAEQGSLLHNILEQWWKAYPDQAQLQRLTHQARTEYITSFYNGCIEKFLQKDGSSVYQASTLEYTHQVLQQYFDFETERDFSRVLKTEYAFTYTFGNITFYLRCDRIEIDQEGKQWLVDYKTGKFSAAGWEPPSMRSPQLPLYAIAYHDPALEGIRVLRLQAEGCQLIESTLQPEWKHDLHQLTQDFEKGVAKVAPREGDKTCQYCQLYAVCRIHE